MANNPEEDISSGLLNLIDEANRLSDTAEQKILEAWEYAINVDRLKPLEAGKVLKKRLKYSPQWINKFLPQEAKQLQFHQDKKVKVVSPFSNTKQKEPENIVIQAQSQSRQDEDVVVVNSSSDDTENDDESDDVVDIKLGMNDCKELKTFLSRVSLLRGATIRYDMRTKKMISIR